MSDESSHTPAGDADAIFRAAIRLKGKARADYIDEACGDDADLRWRVEVLLVDQEKATGALGGEMTIADSRRLADGTEAVIGPYTLGETIGEGSAARVYRAKEGPPEEREVAIKIIRTTIDPEEFLSRIEAERRALAPLSHPRDRAHVCFGNDGGGQALRRDGVRSRRTHHGIL